MNLIIWGTGKGADDLMEILDFDNVSILAFIDNNVKKQGTMYRNIAKIISPQEAAGLQYDLLIIGSISFLEEITMQCEKLGLKNYISSNITMDIIKKYPDIFDKNFLNKVFSNAVYETRNETEKTNYFDVENEFFLIDSDHLESTETKLYGYSIQDTGIYENDNMTEDAIAGLNGCGAYVYVEVTDGKIIIRQDFNGSYGIYLYQKDAYFALSNSFFRLLEHIKTRFPLSLNRDYANHLFLLKLANTVSYRETPVNEIQLIDRNAVITIDTKETTFTFDSVDYAENTLPLNTQEGIDILDDWFHRWTSIFRNLGKYTEQIISNLSGGFDSRLTFMLVLMSGIDLNQIHVDSVKDTLHSHMEDYEIASAIADHYGFRLKDIAAIEDCAALLLNDNGRALEPALPYSLKDIINIEFYTKMAFHKEMHFKYYRPEAKRYKITGGGGEAIKAAWDLSMQESIETNTIEVSRYSPNIAKEMSKSITGLISSTYELIRKKHGIPDDVPIGLLMYQEVRNRSHFGKRSVEDYHYNIYTLAPLIDPELRKLQLSTQECPDKNLLMAMIYVRYCPKLLEFPFEGGRSISPETVEYAKKINEKFPVKQGLFSHHIGNKDSEFNVIIKDKTVSEYMESNILNSALVKGDGEKYLKSIFDSTAFRELFTTCFDEEIYDYAKISYARGKYFPMRECYGIIGIAKVIEFLS